MLLTRFRPKSPAFAVFYLIAAVILFSLSGVLIKLSHWPALALNSGRSLVAALFFLIVLRRPRFDWSGPQIGGAIAYALTLITFVWSTQLTTAANAVFLQFTAPIYVAIFGIWILNERPRRSDIFFMAVIIGGMALFFADELSPAGFTGNLIAIASGVCLAFMIMFLSKIKHSSPIETVLLGNLLSMLVGLPILLQQSWDWREFALMLLMGIVQLGFPFILFTLALKELRALEVMLIQSLEPILNPIWVFIAIAETPAPMALIGSIVVFAAVTGRAIVTVQESAKKG